MSKLLEIFDKQNPTNSDFVSLALLIFSALVLAWAGVWFLAAII